MNNICQSCGMYMSDDAQHGSHDDTTLHEDYCVYCYKNGVFLYDDTMEQKVEKCIEFHIDQSTDENTAREKLMRVFPTLKRWKNS